MKSEDVWSPRGAILGTLGGVVLLAWALFAVVGAGSDPLVSSYELFVAYAVGAPVGSYLFGHVLPKARLARSAEIASRYDAGRSQYSRRFFLAVTGASIAYAALVLVTPPLHF